MERGRGQSRTAYAVVVSEVVERHAGVAGRACDEAIRGVAARRLGGVDAVAVAAGVEAGGACACGSESVITGSQCINQTYRRSGSGLGLRRWSSGSVMWLLSVDELGLRSTHEKLQCCSSETTGAWRSAISALKVPKNAQLWHLHG